MELYKWTGNKKEAAEILSEMPDARLVALADSEETVLLTESESANQPEGFDAYHVLNAVGELDAGYYAVFNNIPVTEDGRELFESRFQNRAGMVEKEPGFAAIRVLRPIDSDTYIILTMWQDEKSFTDWQQSQAYGNAHAKRGTAEGIDKRPNIFPRPSFVKIYSK
ncbi:MAG TPA: antibiotic biosynthesis monooxygenase [Planococcus sp. (in: firmicutes)]|nr:antibiotic biosynthesis monooxygenase [Planococcus sp. (in: firmicutes)]